MSFWKSNTDPPSGKLKLSSSSPTLAQSFLLGSALSHKTLLGVDYRTDYKANQTRPKSRINSLASSDVIHISSIQPNHHRVVSGSVTPNSSIIKGPNLVNNLGSNNGSNENLTEVVSREQVKLNKLEAILTSPNVNLDELKKLAWSGIPSKCRSQVWQLLTGYIPPALDRRTTVLKRKRDEYFSYRLQFFTDVSKLKLNPEDTKHLDEETWHQIFIDVPRTFAHLEMMQKDRIHRALERILYCWAIRHPASGYVQGINDLVVPFLNVFLRDHIPEGKDLSNFDVDSLDSNLWDEVEADTFWCFTKLLDGIQDNYTFAQRGIQRQLKLLQYLMTRIDAQLAQHLEKEGVQYVQFAFRWMNCLLMREFHLDQISEGNDGFNTFHVYVCASFLAKWSSNIQELEFTDIIMYLQDLKTESWQNKDIEVLLAQAYMWQSVFKDLPQKFDG